MGLSIAAECKASPVHSNTFIHVFLLSIPPCPLTHPTSHSYLPPRTYCQLQWHLTHPPISFLSTPPCLLPHTHPPPPPSQAHLPSYTQTCQLHSACTSFSLPPTSSSPPPSHLPQTIHKLSSALTHTCPSISNEHWVTGALHLKCAILQDTHAIGVLTAYPCITRVWRVTVGAISSIWVIALACCISCIPRARTRIASRHGRSRCRHT